MNKYQSLCVEAEAQKKIVNGLIGELSTFKSSTDLNKKRPRNAFNVFQINNMKRNSVTRFSKSMKDKKPYQQSPKICRKSF